MGALGLKYTAMEEDIGEVLKIIEMYNKGEARQEMD